ncbi:MAG: HipA family kinase [Candidatus Promineifilaceae bacterium]
MTPRRTVEIIHRKARNGRTEPIFCSCELTDENVEPQSYFVKLHSNLGDGSIKELVTAHIGRKLGLPIPEAAILEIDPLLLQHFGIDDEQTTNLHIGSRAMLGSYSAFNRQYTFPKHVLPMAFDIFAWDMLIDNADRQTQNPNLLFDGSQFVVIDHENSLPAALFIGARPPAWDFRTRRIATGHAFFKLLKSELEPTSFDRFINRLSLISDQFLTEIQSDVPEEWNFRSKLETICEHFATVRDDPKSLKFELLGTLAS